MFFDALRVKIRDEGMVRNKAVHIALGIPAKGAKFWLRVMNELRHRGVEDILLAVVCAEGNPWCLEMKARLQQNPAKALYALRKQTVEPVFGIMRSAMGFTRFHLRGLPNVATEWTLVALVYNCRRIMRLTAA